MVQTRQCNEFGKIIAKAMIDMEYESIDKLSIELSISSIKIGRLLHSKNINEVLLNTEISIIKTIGDRLNITKELFDYIKKIKK